MYKILSDVTDDFMDTRGVFHRIPGRRKNKLFVPNFKQAATCDRLATTCGGYCVSSSAKRQSRNSVLKIQAFILTSFAHVRTVALTFDVRFLTRMDVRVTFSRSAYSGTDVGLSR